MSEFTPETPDVRNYYAGWVDERSSDSVEEAYAEFDRWLAAHDAELRAEVERLQDALASTLSAAADRIEGEERKRDEARQQVADLRAGIIDLANTLDDEMEHTRAAQVLALAESGGQPGDARERAWLNADPDAAKQNLRAILDILGPDESRDPDAAPMSGEEVRWRPAPVVHNHGTEDGPGLACPETRLPDGTLRGACVAPVVPDSADVRERMHQNWQVFKKHVPVGAYLPVGQMDGDCRECGWSWPCDAVLAAMRPSGQEGA